MEPSSPSEASPPLAILFEDNHCLAVAKPAPMLTQAPAGVASLEATAKAYLKAKLGKPGNVYLGVPHRLDRPVSGVVLFARNSKAAARLAVQFQERTVRKVYWAIVEDGGVLPAEDVWEDWIRKVPDHARAEIAPANAVDARPARLRYRVVDRVGEFAHLEIELETGRMHQIRVQTAARGWPILGDRLYGSARPFGPAVTADRDRVIALHARSLTFLHPLSYESMTLTAAAPPYWNLDALAHSSGL